MYKHPLELDLLVRSRIETLGDDRRREELPVMVGPGDAVRIRRQLGLRLIALGERLAGPVAPGLRSVRPA